MPIVGDSGRRMEGSASSTRAGTSESLSGSLSGLAAAGGLRVYFMMEGSASVRVGTSESPFGLRLHSGRVRIPGPGRPGPGRSCRGPTAAPLARETARLLSE